MSIRSLQASPVLIKQALTAPLRTKPWEEYDEEDNRTVYEVED